MVRTGRRVKRPRQGWRGSSHQGRFTASLRSACFYRCEHFVNKLKGCPRHPLFYLSDQKY
ncbi:hypothetical protein DVQ06_00690 [Yersinia enterocolitica]|nr:hypothetical protein [Yersinia enterocolitica]